MTFKVPAYPFLEESDTFASCHGVDASKLSGSLVITLENVDILEFKVFLRALLPKYVFSLWTAPSFLIKPSPKAFTAGKAQPKQE